MQITELKIRNFRSVKSLDLKLSSTTVLVGPNNAGKSAILDAIRLVLTRRWGQRGTGFTEYDVFLPTPDSDPRKLDPTQIELVLEENEEDQWQEEIITDLSDVIQVNPVTGMQSIRLRVTYTWDDEAGFFEPSWEFLNLAGAVLVSGKRIMNTNTFFSYLPAFHLNALRDAEDEFSPRSQFWGRLLKIMKVPEKTEEEVSIGLDELNKKLIDADPRLSGIVKTLDALQSVSASDDPGGVDIRMLPFDTWDMLSRAQIIAQNEKTTPWLPITRHGQGMQSLSVILLFKAFVDNALTEYFKEESTPVLTLEEPEAHLHPQAARVLWREIQLLPGQKIIATHSPYFIQNTSLRDIRWIKINDEGTGVKFIPESFSTIVPHIPELDIVLAKHEHITYSPSEGKLTSFGVFTEDQFREFATIYGTHAEKTEILAHLRALQQDSSLFIDDETLENFERFSKRIRGEILFARKWILVEGQTEYLLLNAIAEQMGVSLDEKGISVIDFQNNGSPGNFAAVARALNIPWQMVCDGGAEGVGFTQQLENVGFSAQEINDYCTTLPNGKIEEELMKCGIEKELREIAGEIGLDNSDTCSIEELGVFLATDKNKIPYAMKLADLVRTNADVCSKMPTPFIYLISKPEPEHE